MVCGYFYPCSVAVPFRNYVRSETVSSTEIACGAEKPLRSHSKTVMKQEVNTKVIAVQMCLDFGNFG
jgi:hypothetical protein